MREIERGFEGETNKTKKGLTALHAVELGLATSEQLDSEHANDAPPVTASVSASQ